MAFILRFTGNNTGAITFTGNTLGLSVSGFPGAPGTLDYIGALVTTNTPLRFGTFPPGTTNDFNQDSASAVLRLPPGSSILYAELVWAGTYAVTGGTTDFSPFIDKSVSVTTPLGSTVSVAPDPVTAQLLFINGNFNYFRSANVTSIIQAGGAGTYTVGGVVGNIENAGSNSGNHYGWTLCVVYENFSLPFRNLSLNVGIVDIEFAGSPTVNTTISGFVTPTIGPVTGRLQFCAGDGDAGKGGDQIRFGPALGNLTIITGPNNTSNNFFASQINDDSGNVDTAGTFGTRNAVGSVQVVGGRQGWDITNVDVSGTLTNNQTSAVLQLRTASDGYTIYAAGLYIDINAPIINVDKTVDTSQAFVGQILTYTVTVQNTGTTSANSTVIVDPLPNDTIFIPGSVLINSSPAPAGSDPTIGVPVGSLAPGGSVRIQFQVKIATLPIDNVIRNQANAIFQYQSVAGGPILDGNIPSNEVDVIVVPAPQLDIVKTASPLVVSPGELVQYTITVTNPSFVELTNVRLEDSLLGLINVISSLAPGTTTNFIVDFFVPPGTPANSTISNITTVTSDQTPPISDDAQVLVLPSFDLAITKTPDRVSAAPGETVTYTLTVTNLSNATLNGVTVTDSLTGFALDLLPMAPGNIQVFKVLFTIPPGTTAGTTFTNVATATSNETGPRSDQATVIVTPIPTIFVFKTVDQPTAAPGDTVIYTITVSNAGNQTLTNVRITDPTLGIDQTIDALTSGDTFILTQPFVVSATAIQGDTIVNTVNVVTDQTPPEQSNAIVTVIADPTILLTKTVFPTEAAPGSSVTYTFNVTNTGNTTLTNVQIVDPLLGLNQTLGTLAVGDSRTINFPFVVPNISLTPFINIATVTGNAGVQTVIDSSSASLDILLPAFTLTKSVDRATANPGDTVNFTFVITNTGTLTLTNVNISDPLLSYVSTIPQLDPGATVTLTLPFDISEDALAGTVFTNTVTVTPTELGPQQASVDVTVSPAPAIELTKTPDVDNGLPGDTVNYTITVTNTGNQALTSVGVSDELLGLNTVIQTLGIGESQSYVLSFIIPLGTPIGTIITNVSTAVSDQTDSVDTIAHVLVNPLPPVVTIVKTPDRLTAAPGETVTYSITVTNAGTVVLTNVLLTDEVLVISQLLGTLNPGDTQTLFFTFVVPADAEPGSSIVNTAVVTTDQGNPKESTTTVTVLPLPALLVTKALDMTQAAPGQTVTATITVRNTGNVDLTNVSIADPTLDFSATVPLLPAGATEVYTIPFEVPFVPAGTVITNTATTTSDQTEPSTSTASLTVLAQFQLSLNKRVEPATAAPGETVTFTFELRNLSNAPLTNVRFVDELLGIDRTVDLIPVGFFTVVSRTFTIPAGSLGGSTTVNIATASSDETEPVTAAVSITVRAIPQLALSKIVEPEVASPGETVFFRLAATNTGNVPLTNIRFADPFLRLVATVVSLDVGATVSAIVPFVVPTTAVPGSEIVNTLLVVSSQLAPQQVVATVQVAGFPVTVTKEASCQSIFVGDTLKFSIRISNTSQSTINNVVLTDVLQEGTKFISDSVHIDNKHVCGANPESGINISSLAPNQSVLVTFLVKQKFEPPSKKVRNSTTVTFIPEGATETLSVISNTVVIKVDEHAE
ncbi:hypothetical protein NQ117_00265 [Paenibacillus sp. SC116]|uniref:DUF7507 domain-containing protein n=1 Tax=Paenibacillus sp. SC116 TaxID=2968986 RepID=UPI00215B2C87|nr:hypothetical protein [Paenibacillus sp. SC116]MCR8842107.1 hypothetical protein [Paenibacillus sp. SC116]